MSTTTRSAFTRLTGRILPCFYGKHDRLLELDGLYHYFYGREKVPMKLEPGNTNYELAWGSAGIVDYLDTLGGGTGDRASIARAYDDIAEQEDAVGGAPARGFSARATTFGSSAAGTRDVGARVPTVAFKARGRDAGRDRAGSRQARSWHSLRRFPFATADRALGAGRRLGRRAGVDGPLQHAR